jgi:nucleoside-diphosphate-sugar epimerase
MIMFESEADLPDVITNESELEELLSKPSSSLIDMMKRLDEDLIILGVSGKIGPNLARTALRAIKAANTQKKIIGVDLFTEEGSKERFMNMDIELIECDLMEPGEIEKLPRVKNVIYLAGRKFGTQDNEELTWMINVIVPANCARHFSASRIVAFSTGCVYPLVETDSICTEKSRYGPVGEYAQSCLGRERVFSYYSKINKTPVSLIRLSYAVDLHYGVLYDIGRMVLEDKPIDLKMAYFNTIWQGDVNNQTLMFLEHCSSPPSIWNVTRPEIVSMRSVAEEFARIMDKKALFYGKEGHKYFLSDTSKAIKVVGPPTVSLGRLIRWQAHWLLSGGRSLNKPTHFEENEGEY